MPSDNNLDRDVEENKIGIRFTEVIVLIVVGIICFIPVSLIIWVYPLALTTPYIIEPEFEIYNIYSNISAGLFLVVQDLEILINIQREVVKQMLQLLSIALFILAVVLLFIYSSHIIEVSS